MKDLIQVAGISDWQEAELVMGCGVDWLGFPLRLPVNREDLSEEEAGIIIRSLPASVEGVVITYEKTADSVIELCRKLGARHIQLHGDIDQDELKRLRRLWPDLYVLKSLVVRCGQEKALDEAVRSQAEWIDAFITDTFDPQSGASGATGKTHDWSVSRHLVDISPKPVMLAGGLNPENVFQAIQAVRPAGVDVHTGVEGLDGRKDSDLVRKFVQEAQRGFQALA